VNEDQSFLFAERPYLLALQKDGRNPFLRLPRAPGEESEEEDDSASYDSEEEEPVEV